MVKNRVDVAIDGQIITLISEGTEAYLKEVAKYIDKKLSEIKSAKSSRPISESLRTMHIAANIADDYFKTLHIKQELEETNKTYMIEMRRIQEENLLLKTELVAMSKETTILEEKVANLEMDKQNLEERLKQAKDELEEYISTFDDRPEEKKERLNVVKFSKY